MQASEQSRFDALYPRHVTALKLQGKVDKTIESHAWAMRRVAVAFDRCPDDLAVGKPRAWRKLKARYLFHARSLTKVFRAKMLDALRRAGIPLPGGLPDRWIVDCRNVGRGLPR